jgi:hypothetical protein
LVDFFRNVVSDWTVILYFDWPVPIKKGKRAKGVQMTEQQPKTPQIIDIVEMQPTADIVQSPPTQNGSQTSMHRWGTVAPFD